MPSQSTKKSSKSANPAADSNVGKETLAYCTSCKMDLNHIIVAMKGDKIAKAECQTCKKIHGFKAPKGITEPKVKKAKRSKKDDSAATAMSIEVEWEKLMNAHKDLPFKSYNTKAGFKLGDKIRHTSFGEGIVGKLIFPNKIEVIFKTDIRLLIHAGIQAQQ